MLTNLSLKNIKSFNENSTLQIAPITLIYGPNSSGKSSLWKFFLALKDSSVKNSSNNFLNLSRSDFANIKTLSFDRSKKSTFTINFSKTDKKDSTVFAYHFKNPLPINEGMEELAKEVELLNKLSAQEQDKLIGLINKITDKYKNNSNPESKPEKIQAETIDEALDQIRREQQKTTEILANQLHGKKIREGQEGENLNNLKIDELEIIQADKSLITFKIVELPKIKKTEGAFFARRSSRIDAAEQEKNIKNTILEFYKNNYADQKIKFDVKISTRKELYNEFRDGDYQPQRIFDMVGPNGPKEIKKYNSGEADNERFLFFPTKISKDKSLWIKYFDFLQFLKSKMKKNNKDKKDDKEIYEGYINENFRDEHIYLENQWGINSDDIPEIRNTFNNTLKIMTADLDEFIEIMTKDLETFVMSGKSFIPDQRFYGARILKIIFDEIADKFLDAHLGNIGPDGELEPITDEGQEIINEIGKLVPFSLVDQIRNLFKFNDELTKFKKSNFNSSFPFGTTGANYSMSRLLSNGIHEDEEYKDKIIKLLEKINLPFKIDTQTDEDGDIKASFSNKKITKSQEGIPLEQSGNGLKSVLTLLSELIKSENSTMIIEEPENKIHPQIQGNLIELITEIIKNNSSNAIIETHSEHFILRIQKLIREKKISPKLIAINYVYLDENGEGSKIDHMQINDNGKFTNKWRHGFFNERLKEI